MNRSIAILFILTALIFGMILGVALTIHPRNDPPSLAETCVLIFKRAVKGQSPQERGGKPYTVDCTCTPTRREVK